MRESLFAPAPRVPVLPSAFAGPAHPELGVDVRLRWKERYLGSTLLDGRAGRAVTVGDAVGVDFVVARRWLGCSVHSLVRATPSGFVLAWRRTMAGCLVRGGQSIDLARARADGLVELGSGDELELVLEEGDAVTLALGPLVAELRVVRAPRRVGTWREAEVDWLLVNLLLFLLIVVGAFAIAAANQALEGEPVADDLDLNRPAHWLKIAAVPPPRAPLALDHGPSKDRPQPSAAHQGRQGALGPRRGSTPVASEQVRQRVMNELASVFGRPFGASASVFQGPGLGEALRGQLVDLQSARRHAGLGGGGLGLQGDGDGGGGLQGVTSVGLLPIRVRGPAVFSRQPGLHPDDFGSPDVKAGPVLVCGLQGPSDCGLDKNLIREVIHSHRGQIRYCYEEAMTRNPSLQGKVRVRFVIGSDGAVPSAQVAESTVGHAGLEQCVASRVGTWRFPKPRTGSQVVVLYPFLFKPSGE